MKIDGIGSIVISQNQKPVGIVTDWDIVTEGFFTTCTPSSIIVSKIIKKLYSIEG
jgi:hypothetical protein